MPPLPPTLPELEARFFIAGPTIHRQNTVVTPTLDGEPYFKRLGNFIKLCNRPGDVIYIVGWGLDKDPPLPGTSGPFGNFLVGKALLGVDVRLLVWAARWLSDADMADSVPEKIFNFCAETLAGSYAQRVQANISDIQELRLLGGPETPLKGTALLDWSGTRSHHAKYVVAKAGNELRAFIGPDILPGYLDVPQHVGSMQWHEVGIEVEGAAVKSVWQDFLDRWEECSTLPPARLRTGTGIDFYNTPSHFPEVPPPEPPALPPQSISVQVLRSYGRWKRIKAFDAESGQPWTRHPPQGVKEIRTCMQKALLAASRYIYVEDQALNDSMNLHDAVFPFIAQACNNNVKVIFVTSSAPDVIFDLPWDSGLSWEVEEKILDNIDPSKQQNFVLYRVDKLTVHSKVVLIDDRFMMIGSANFFEASMTGVDSELSVAVVDTGRLIENLRIELWKDHLRLGPDMPNLPQIEEELRDLDKSLAVWRPRWGTGVSFRHPGPVLSLVGPPHEVP
jgi:phosphatidylserine/phosphatidylglycerophosphate/cardiolipin synthase-like enzyme